ncbi:hypothetical protein [Thalassotalea sp. PLHSN55]|uniref:hypothetical protein n=1 Tax=Thalassotalea sp. PLHSN55 TaxID=3435888 RepID=UPI003F867C50
MYNRKKTNSHWPTLLLLLSSSTLLLSGCDSSDDDSDTTESYYQLYNASVNAPQIYLTVTESSDEDDSTTYSGIAFADASSYLSNDADQYDLELSWLDDDDNLSAFYQTSSTLAADTIEFIVVDDDITAPNILSYAIAIDDPDSDEGFFNVQFLNLHNYDGGIDLYISESDESFNEAQLISHLVDEELSPLSSYDLESYVFYITAAGDEEVLYQSEAITFSYTNQHMMVIRENQGPGDSPFTIDKIGNSASVVNYPDEFSQAQVRIYNAIGNHDLLDNYQDNVTLNLTGLSEDYQYTNLTLGSFTGAVSLPFGDYSIDLVNPITEQSLITNHLLTLNPNDDKSVFFYLDEEVTENDDGEEETEIYIRSLVTDNSSSESIYDHQVSVISFVEDYSIVKVYFVRSNETIDNTSYSIASLYASPKEIVLYNNTYRVYAVATDGSSDIILASQELILSEQSKEMFLMIEESDASSTGYSLQFIDQQE